MNSHNGIVRVWFNLWWDGLWSSLWYSLQHLGKLTWRVLNRRWPVCLCIPISAQNMGWKTKQNKITDTLTSKQHKWDKLWLIFSCNFDMWLKLIYEEKKRKYCLPFYLVVFDWDSREAIDCPKPCCSHNSSAVIVSWMQDSSVAKLHPIHFTAKQGVITEKQSKEKFWAWKPGTRKYLECIMFQS